MAVINLLELKRLATSRSFARGEAYFKDDRVHSLAAHEGTYTAIVSGQDDYSVTLSSTEREINYSCDCPIGLEGEFCKHLVAVGLASLNPGTESKGKPSNRKGRQAKTIYVHISSGKTKIPWLLYWRGKRWKTETCAIACSLKLCSRIPPA